MPGLSSYLKNQLLDSFTEGELFLALHSEEPGDDGENELIGGGYERQSVNLIKDGNGGFIINQDNVNFVRVPSRTVSYLAIWDSKEKGNYLWSAPVPAAQIRRLVVGDGLQFPTASLQIRFS